MTPTEAARRLVTLPGWEWGGGMWWQADTDCPACHGAGGFRWMNAGGEEEGEQCPCGGRVEFHPGFSNPLARFDGAIPDLEDPATQGAALGMLSRRVGGYVWIEPTGWRGGVLTWDARCQMPHGTRRVVASGASWAEAFVAAWEATPPPA